MRTVLATLAIAMVTLLAACGGSDKKSITPAASVSATLAPASSPARAAATSTAVPATIAVSTPPPATATLAAPTAAPPTLAPQATEPAPAPTEAPPPPPPPPSGGGALTLVAINILFDAKALSAAAGPVTITLDNQDRGIAHNIHFFSKTGSIGVTDIDTGPSIQTLSLGVLAPGAYSFKCDVHPTTMTGILTVS